MSKTMVTKRARYGVSLTFVSVANLRTNAKIAASCLCNWTPREPSISLKDLEAQWQAMEADHRRKGHRYVP